MKYIYKRQIIGYFTSFVLTTIYSVCFIDNNIFLCMFGLLGIIAVITFLPAARKEMQYPYNLHTLLYYLPMYVWGGEVIVHPEKFRFISCPIWFRLGCIFTVLLLVLSRWKDIYRIVNHPSSNLPISKRIFFEEILSFFVALLSEEIFFSAFLITLLKDLGSYIAIIISAIVFVIIHYLNRWSGTMFNKKDYLYMGMLAIIKGMAYLRTSDLFLVIALHFIYNTSDLYVLIKRYNIRDEKVFFDDY